MARGNPGTIGRMPLVVGGALDPARPRPVAAMAAIGQLLPVRFITLALVVIRSRAPLWSDAARGIRAT